MLGVLFSLGSIAGWAILISLYAALRPLESMQRASGAQLTFFFFNFPFSNYLSVVIVAAI